MRVDDDGQVTLTVEEFKHRLDVRGEGARDVAVAFTAAFVLVSNALGIGWTPWVFLAIALARVAYCWRRDRLTRGAVPRTRY
jgi:hypothetical protein